MTLELDLTHPSNQRDPFPLYRWLREEDPVHWSHGLKMWVVTRYEDVLLILQQPLRYSSDRFRRIGAGLASRRPDILDIARMMRDWAVYRDPPDHTRLRGLLNATFTPRKVEMMRPRIQRIVDDLLDRVEGRERMEFISEFAFPLPATVIAAMLGVPGDDLAQIKIWSDQIAAYIGGAHDGRDTIDEAKRGLLHTCEYFRALMRARKAAPQEDLISLMLAAEDRGDMLSDEEVVSNCVLLLFAGHETTMNLLGNGLFHLLRHPTQYRMLRENPGLLAGAVEEFLRYDPPVTATLKVASEEIELRGRHIGRGDMVMAVMASANRDPRQFESPDDLIITRESRGHLSFGHGIHFCLGAPLARLEAHIAFSALLRRLDDLTLLDEAPQWKPQIFFRGLQALPLGFRTRRPSM